MRQILLAGTFIFLFTSCTSISHREATDEISTRSIASSVKRKSIQVSSLTCSSAYNKALSSPSVGVLIEATDLCEKAAESRCTVYVEKNSDGAGTGDGRWLASACELTAAFGANKAVFKGAPSEKCASAYKAALNSPSAGDLSEAAELCATERAEGCRQKVENESDGPRTGDGQWMAAACELTAAHGAYIEVSKYK